MNFRLRSIAPHHMMTCEGNRNVTPVVSKKKTNTHRKKREGICAKHECVRNPIHGRIHHHHHHFFFLPYSLFMCIRVRGDLYKRFFFSNLEKEEGTLSLTRSFPPPAYDEETHSKHLRYKSIVWWGLTTIWLARISLVLCVWIKRRAKGPFHHRAKRGGAGHLCAKLYTICRSSMYV